MDTSKLSSFQRDLRSNIRGFLLTATLAEMEGELQISVDRNDNFRADCIREVIEEHKRDNSN